MPLISHRGAAGLADANTPKAILTGDTYNPKYIEVDINLSADSVLVIHHGFPTRFLRGIPTKETYAELKAENPELCTFIEFLKFKVKAPYMFDIKIHDNNSLDEIIEALKKFYRQDFSFTSPHEKSLVRMKKAFPAAEIYQSQPYHHGPINTLEIARKHGFDGVALNKWWLTPLVYKLCRLHNKKIMAYTIDSAAGIWAAQRLFPGALITTNRPDIYRRIFPTE